jgi:hypothetical protein
MDVNFLDFVDLWVCDEYNEQIHVNDEQIYEFWWNE